MKLFYVLVTGLMCFLFSVNIYANPSRSDILFVLDNSGSMKKNDSEFSTSGLVLKLIKGLGQESRAGIIAFDAKSYVVMPLTSIADKEFAKKAAISLSQLSYNGKYTNIPHAIEKALYLLKQDGRNDAEKMIIFMTDGHIDTGDTKKNAELDLWLRDELTREAKNEGIRIYSLAFTEDADFELIQTLAVRTGGDYFRAGKSENLEKVFDSIRQAVFSPSKYSEPETVPEGGSKEYLFIVILIGGLIISGIVAFGLRSKRSASGSSKIPQTPSCPTENSPHMLPAAILEDIEMITGKKEIRLSKREITIGRAVDTDKRSVDIAIPQNTVSALHAFIEYRDNSFFITDLRSTNKTYLNSQPLSPDIPQRLKSGDLIAFDKYSFRLIVKEQIGKGGTVFTPGSAGGTIIRPIRQKQIQQAPYPQQQEIDQLKDYEDETHVKPSYCEIHPSFKATEICPICKKGFCSECMIEMNGTRICRSCADDLP
jgi:Mg-chelatase subunit ChlD